MRFFERDESGGVLEENAEIAVEPQPRRNGPRYLLHGTLFLLTFLSTTYAGLMFVLPPSALASVTDPSGVWRALIDNFHVGLPFGALLMLFLTAHEFGHYFAAKAHGVDATLPFYIPMPFFLFGTLGAVIRTRTPIPNRRALFDIGVAGPLAGFVVALGYLVIGMATMPGIESLYRMHPEYRLLESLPDYGTHFGGFLLFSLLKQIIVPAGAFFPPMNEIYHYPFLAIGWFGMFVTALNMIPVGQLDGGHIVYAMFGERQSVISRWFVGFLLFVGIGGVGLMLLEATRGYSNSQIFIFLQSVFGPAMEWIDRHASWWFLGWLGWLLWVVILKFFIRIDHPPIMDQEPLDKRRMAIGWVSLGILVLTFSFTGIYDKPGAPVQPVGPVVESVAERERVADAVSHLQHPSIPQPLHPAR